MSESLPAGWLRTKLGELADFEMGQAPPGAASNFEGIGTLFVKAGEFGPIQPVEREWTTQPLKFARTGDVLICVVGATAGKLNLGADCAIGRSVAAIRPSGALLQRALYFQLLPRVAAMRATSSGSAQGVISQADLSRLEVDVPPLAEQARIVSKLEELLSDLDAGVTELKAAQKKLQQYRQSLLKAAVEGSLTAAWREVHPAPEESGADLLARILRERRARWEAQQLAKFEAQGKAPPKGWHEAYIEPAAPDLDGLPALPTGWTWASAEQLCTFITKGTTPPKGHDASGDKVIPFLRVTNLTDRGALDLTDKVFVSVATHQGFLARSVVFPGDVLMNIVGPPLGQVAVVPDSCPEWNINQAIAIFRAVDGVLSSFVCSYLLSPVAQQWLKARAKTTAGQTNLTLDVCRRLPVPLPPFAEQGEIVTALTGQMDSLAMLANAAPVIERQSTAQRQNLLRAAFAGQLVPQDPADEPAAELLACIRAERAAQGSARRPRAKPAHVANSLNSVETIAVGAVE